MAVTTEAAHWIETFEFERLGRSNFVLDFADDDEAQSAVDRMADAVIDEFRIRKALSRFDPRDVAPLKWLRPVCYHAILHCLHADLFEFLEVRLEHHGRLVRGPKCERSVFMVGIVGIFAEDKPRIGSDGKLVKPLTDEKDRMRLADQMWWAFRHYAQPKEILQFNRRFSLHRQASKPPKDFLFRELYQQIIARRGDVEDESRSITFARGAYPDEINRALAERDEKRRLEWENSDSDANWDADDLNWN